jgi:hypothetical protein
MLTPLFTSAVLYSHPENFQSSKESVHINKCWSPIVCHIHFNILHIQMFPSLLFHLVFLTKLVMSLWQALWDGWFVPDGNGGAYNSWQEEGSLVCHYHKHP